MIMKEFFGYTVELENEEERDYRTFFDQERVRFATDDAKHVVEFSLQDPSQVLHSEQVPVEDIEQLSFFLRDNQDIMLAELQGTFVEVPEDMDKLFETPSWLQLPWINLSQVCMLLYGKKDSSTRAYFALKRKNKRPWKEDELQKLESIHQQLMEEMRIAAQSQASS